MSLGMFSIRGCQSCGPTSRATETRIHQWKCQPWLLLPVTRFLRPFGCAARAEEALGADGGGRTETELLGCAVWLLRPGACHCGMLQLCSEQPPAGSLARQPPGSSVTLTWG